MDNQEALEKLVAAMRTDETLIESAESDPVGIVARVAEAELELEAASQLCEDAIMQVAAESLGDSLQTLSRLS